MSGQRSGVIAARNIGSCDHLHDATSGTDETNKRSPVGTSGASVEVGAARAASPRDRRDAVSVGHTGTGQTNTSLVGTSPTGAGRADTGCADTQKEAVIARKIRAQGLAAGRTTAAIAVAIHDECEPIFGTTWIKAYRLAAGTALADIVEQVRALYECEGRTPPRFSETLLSAYESGNKRPGIEYLHYLCVVYRAEPADIGFPARCFCGRSHRAAALSDTPIRRAEPDGAVGNVGGQHGAGSTAVGWRSRDQFSHPGEEHEDVLRRTLLQLIGGAGITLDSRFFGAVDGARRRLDDALLKSGVAATTLDQWEEAAAGYGRQYMTVPPLRLLCDVLLDLGDVRRMCETRQSIEAQERLCRLAAQLAALTGMTMIDVGDHRMARSFFRTARTAADETGDRALRAWVVAREGLVPLYYGDAREALRLARISQDLAGRVPCSAGALAPMIEARALAKASPGHPAAKERAKRAIARAHSVFGQLSDDQSADTAFGYTERQLLFHEGETLAGLGAAEADSVLADALDAYPHTERLDRSLICFNRAMFRLLRGEVEEALRIGEETISDLPVDDKPEIVLRRARDLACAVAAASGDRIVQNFRDQLAGLPSAVNA